MHVYCRLLWIIQTMCLPSNSVLPVDVFQRLLAVYLSNHVIIQSPQHENDGVLHEVSTVHSYLLR